MEKAYQVNNDQAPIPDVEFEKTRCGKCGGYLNCPPIMAFIGYKDNYAECGRCFDEGATKRAGLFAMRNRALELLASVTPFPCKNHKDGCTERRLWPQIEMHEAECLHRAFNCPLSVLQSCTYRGGLQKLVEHFQEKHPEFLLTDGSLNEVFDKNFENHYLVQQHTNVFVLQVKYDINMKKAWFVANLLEETDESEFSLEFTGGASTSPIVMKYRALFKPMTLLDVNDALEIDLQAVKTLLKEPENIKYKICLYPRTTALRSTELLKEIQCPACWDFMKGKIFLCKNGHNMCSKCKEFVLYCPTCRDSILDVRNLSLEKVIGRAIFPCKNHDLGCNYVASLEETIYHYRHCPLTTSD